MKLTLSHIENVYIYRYCYRIVNDMTDSELLFHLKQDPWQPLSFDHISGGMWNSRILAWGDIQHLFPDCDVVYPTSSLLLLEFILVVRRDFYNRYRVLLDNDWWPGKIRS